MTMKWMVTSLVVVLMTTRVAWPIDVIFFQCLQKVLGFWPDREWIWLELADFKHDYIEEVYWSDVCFVSHVPVRLTMLAFLGTKSIEMSECGKYGKMSEWRNIWDRYKYHHRRMKYFKSLTRLQLLFLSQFSSWNPLKGLWHLSVFN